MKNLKLIAVLILLPLCLALFGAWELQRSTDTQQEQTQFLADLHDVRPELEDMNKRPGTQWIEIWGERTTVPQALQRIDRVLSDLQGMQAIWPVLNVLAVTVIVLGALAALVGTLGLAGLHWAGARARQSRELLLSTFTRIRKLLPFVLVGHIVAMSAAVAAILAYEALAMWHVGRMSAGEMKVMVFVAIAALGCLYSIWHMSKQLRVMLHMFEPTPMEVLGQSVSPEQAPGLWALVRGLAEQLGALAPDHIVLGVGAGFYVTSSEVTLVPAQASLTGRTLHVPILYLGLLDKAETSAVIGHELGHFVGADTEYSLRFLPIYAGIGRSLGLIGLTMAEGDILQRNILRPAFMLGEYFMEQFDHAANHWSRVRELAADAAGACLAGHAAAASALVRISAIDPLLQEQLAVHIDQVTKATAAHVLSADLATSVINGLAEKTLQLPDEELATQLPHPSDTHPSNGERIAALQITVEDAVLSGTRPVHAQTSLDAMEVFFADPKELRTRLADEFVAHYVTQDAEVVEQLRSFASNATEEVRLHQGLRSRGWVFLVLGAVFALAAVAALVARLKFAWMDAKGEHVLLISCVAAVFFALVFLIGGVRMLRNADKTALLLTPDHFVFPNFKAPLPIQHIADFGLNVGQGVRLTLLLEEDAPLPELLPSSYFSVRGSLNKKKRLVHLQLLQACRDNKKLKDEELAQLIGDYVSAGNARYLLQQRMEQA